MLFSVFGALARLALLVLPVCRLVCRAKPNVPFVRLAKIELKKSAVGKNKKYRRVGKECRLTRCPNVISSLCLCSLVKMVYFFSFSVFSRLFNDVVSVCLVLKQVDTFFQLKLLINVIGFDLLRVSFQGIKNSKNINGLCCF